MPPSSSGTRALTRRPATIAVAAIAVLAVLAASLSAGAISRFHHRKSSLTLAECSAANMIMEPVGSASGDLGCVRPTDYQRAIAALPGLVRSLPLDERVGPTAVDVSPNHRNGQISDSGVTFGAIDTVAGGGNGRRAIGLGANAGSVKIDHEDALNLGTMPGTQWMIMTNVQVNTSTGYPSILAKGNDRTNGFNIFADPANNAVGFLVNGKQYAWGNMSLSAMRSLAVAFDGTTLHFFVNGTEVGTNQPTPQQVTDTGPLTVGKGGNITTAKLVIANKANVSTIPSLFRLLRSGTTSTSPDGVSPGTDPTTAPSTSAPGTTTAPPTLPAPPTTKPVLPIPTTTPPGTAPPASAPSNGARLVWADEFNGGAGSGVDSGTWYQETGAPTNSGRVEYLTPGTNNVALDGAGDLAITARRENYGGRSFTSGRIESNKSFTTGYLEIRAKLTTWSGSSPSLWTFGAAGYGAGTGFSEIDLLETRTRADLDPAYGRQTIHGVLPDGSSLWQLGWSSNMVSFAPGMPGSAWHTYGAYVSPSDQSVSFYVDGRRTATYSRGQQPSGGNWPYGSVAQKVIVDVEMGLFSGGQIGTDRNSDTMLVDYVRTYDRPPF